MPKTVETTQVVSVFGSGYVPEAHDPDHLYQAAPTYRQRLIRVVVPLLVFCSAAGAVS